MTEPVPATSLVRVPGAPDDRAGVLAASIGERVARAGLERLNLDDQPADFVALLMGAAPR